ncbi:ABC transporter ATP-binding protein [Bradyrhizobium sp. NP1]|uniref:ABC transporter ATP-binding protein n=1 Tax=Bradyrhizobium sp. NP1 TaxID=3049772 RepID=UPI0025A5E1DB|nr:ABC transporter ATP-binding protein [Bradyrhizobium sp. NP1]WJR80937.1 ABC transporter ATP-binding protein [Bradyrhizobium sp. NP1]
MTEGLQTPVALNMKRVEKTYMLANGTSAIALAPVTTRVFAGEFVSFVGPSGCGKTTLLKMCAGLVSPSRGHVGLGETDVPVGPGSYGFVFQSAALLPWKTVLANVMLPANILHLDKQQARQRALQLLDMVKLSRAPNKYPHELSGGMQQRVSIARAMLHDPELIFMDEPFGALDAMTREELNIELQRLHQKNRKTVLFVTHDIDEAVLLSDRILVLSAGPGRVVAELKIDLPRPRSAADKLSPEFRRYALEIRALLDEQRDPAEEMH